MWDMLRIVVCENIKLSFNCHDMKPHNYSFAWICLLVSYIFYIQKHFKFIVVATFMIIALLAIKMRICPWICWFPSHLFIVSIRLLVILWSLGCCCLCSLEMVTLHRLLSHLWSLIWLPHYITLMNITLNLTSLDVSNNVF